MKAPQVRAAHPLAVIDRRERRGGRVDRQRDARRPRVEAVGDDLGEYCLIEVAGIGIGEVLEEVQQIDAGLAHRES